MVRESKICSATVLLSLRVRSLLIDTESAGVIRDSFQSQSQTFREFARTVAQVSLAAETCVLLEGRLWRHAR